MEPTNVSLANRGTGKGIVVLQVALWSAQIFLAFLFSGAGFIKITQPIDALAEMFVWPGEVPPALVRFIGVSEVAGAIGLILPAATRIQPWLTPLAAAGLATIMLLAMGYHVVIGEWQHMNVILGALAAFVAWGRYRRLPIAPRGSPSRNDGRSGV